MSLLAVSQRSIDVWVGPEESRFHWIMACRAVELVQEDESPSLQILGASSFALRTLTWYLRWRLNSFHTRTLQRIPLRLLVGLCVQRAVAERDSNESCYLHSPWASAAAVWTCGSFSWRWSCSPDSLSEGSSWEEEANGPTTFLVVVVVWSASQGDGDGPTIYLGDGQTEAPGVPDRGQSEAPRGGKWMQRRAAPAHATRSDLTWYFQIILL